MNALMDERDIWRTRLLVAATTAQQDYYGPLDIPHWDPRGGCGCMAYCSDPTAADCQMACDGKIIEDSSA